MKNQSEKGFSAVELVLVVAVVGLIGFAVWRAYEMHQTATLPSTTTSPNAATVNSWTAKGTDFKFSDAKNWSLGTPKNGQDLTINTDTVATDSADGKLTDDMPSLSIGRLTILGSKTPVTGLALTISGQPLTITGGISDQITASGAQVTLGNDLTLSGK